LSMTYDAPMREAISHGDVVMVGAIEHSAGQSELLLPRADLLYSLRNMMGDVALANLVQEPDGVIRRLLPALERDAEAPRLTIGAMVATRLRELDPTAEQWVFGEETIENGPTAAPIHWSGPPGTFPKLSFERLLKPAAASDPAVIALAGKVVILGSDHFGLHDFHLTPYASSVVRGAKQFMSGAEIQANIIETLLSGRIPRSIPIAFQVLLVLAFVALAARAATLWPPVVAFVVTLVAMAGAALLSLVAFRFEHVIDVGTSHLGMLFAYIGAMTFRLTGERRRRRDLMKTFGRYVSHEVVERLSLSGRSPDLGGETVALTVMFMDIRNFTTISERLSAQEVVGMLNAFFSRAVEPILAEGGMVNNYLGDGMLALFGSPVPYGDHTERAIRAALELDRVARAFPAWMHENLPGRDLPEFAVGIGVHTGDAVTGNVGSQKRMQFTAIGDTVNTAARVESSTKTLGIRVGITRSVVDAVTCQLELGKRDTVSVKGRKAEVEIFELVGLTNAAPVNQEDPS
ncbi:MAG: adenylate cyclase, partial [Myxococcota bacterium]